MERNEAEKMVTACAILENKAQRSAINGSYYRDAISILLAIFQGAEMCSCEGSDRLCHICGGKGYLPLLDKED